MADYSSNWNPLYWIWNSGCTLLQNARDEDNRPLIWILEKAYPKDTGIGVGSGGFATNVPSAKVHLGNLFWHIMDAVLLFLLLNRMLRRVWPSAFVAALFAFYPTHVESVAWASERKDVLSTFFLILALWAYTRYAERPNVLRYLTVLGLFLGGLMSKPMLVSVPLLMMILDWWPLKRTSKKVQASGAYWLQDGTALLVMSGLVLLIGGLAGYILVATEFIKISTSLGLLSYCACLRGSARRRVARDNRSRSEHGQERRRRGPKFGKRAFPQNQKDQQAQETIPAAEPGRVGSRRFEAGRQSIAAIGGEDSFLPADA